MKPLAGNVPVSFDSLRVLIPLLQPGRVRGLAVTSAARSPLLLELPAVAEVLPGYEVTAFNFIAVRRGTPAPIIGRLSRELAVCMREPRTMQRNAPLNVDSLGTRRMSWRSCFARNHLLSRLRCSWIKLHSGTADGGRRRECALAAWTGGACG